MKPVSDSQRPTLKAGPEAAYIVPVDPSPDTAASVSAVIPTSASIATQPRQSPETPLPASAAAVPTNPESASSSVKNVPQRRVSLKDPTRRGSEAYHTEGKVSDYYTIATGNPIGKGGFGEVRLGTRKSDGKT